MADRDFAGYQSPSSGYTTHTTGAANKFLGVTATSSQDIQLGLTFTVPFLSIPLNSINSLIGGNFADIGNFLNFGNLGKKVVKWLLALKYCSMEKIKMKMKNKEISVMFEQSNEA